MKRSSPRLRSSTASVNAANWFGLEGMRTVRPVLILKLSASSNRRRGRTVRPDAGPGAAADRDCTAGELVRTPAHHD